MPYRRQYLGDFERAQAEHREWPVVISEGDSWFSYADTIGRLDDPRDLGDPKYQRPWCLLRLERAGDEVMTILSGAQRSRLRDVFGRWPIDALLFSAGGNDLIGPDLLPLLVPYAAGAAAEDLLAEERLARRLRQIQDCYRELLDLIADAPQETKVLVNSYDYARPSDAPVKLFGIVKVAGPWMRPYFEQRGIPEPLRVEVIRVLIDRFSAAIDEVAAEPRGRGRLVRVETRGVVGNDWKDEIHPSRQGAKRVAAAFERALRDESVLT